MTVNVSEARISAPPLPWVPALTTRYALLITALLAIFSAFVGAVYAKPPTASPADIPSAPILRVEAGMHTAPITRIGVDRAGQILVTGSLDKTVRIWSLVDGSLLRTLRLPIGNGHEGEIDAVALSPDGKIVACGGYTSLIKDDYSTCVYLFSRETGVLIRRLPPLPGLIYDLSFSQDGHYLAVGSSSGGIRVLNAADGTLVLKDDYDGTCYGTDWGAADQLVTSSSDGFIRLYAAKPQLKLIAKAKTSVGSKPYAVRFSPNGNRIAVGYIDSNFLSVLSSRNLESLYSPDVTGIEPTENFSSVCWSSDGNTLFAAGTASDGSGNRIIRSWSDGGLRAYHDTAVAKKIIYDLRTLPTDNAAAGAIAYASAEPTWGVLKANGSLSKIGRQSPTFNYVHTYLKLLTSQNGDRLGLRYDQINALPLLDIDQRAFTDAGNTPIPLEPDIEANEPGGSLVSDWDESSRPTLKGGTPLAGIAHGEVSHSLAIAPDHQSFLLGTNFYLRCFDKNGTEKWHVDAPGGAQLVNVAPGGEVGAIAIAACDDGIIRWYRMRDGKELLDFFPDADKKHWVLWTPQGYYDCSPGGEDLIGWQINHGEDHAADFYSASGFQHKQYYRPNVVRYVLNTLDIEKALELADERVGDSNGVSVATPTQFPPTVRIVSPEDFSRVSTATVTVGFTVQAPADAPVTRVRVLVDGRSPEGSRGFDFGALAASSVSAGTAEGSSARQITVPLPGHDCIITLIAENKNGASERASVRVQSPTPISVSASALKPKLYVLAVGVAKYAVPGNNLTFPSKDASDFAVAVKAQSGKLYRDVEVRTVVDTQATKANVLNGLEWIERQATSRDVAMVFISGHGDIDPDGDYYFLTHDFDGVRWKSTAVSYRDIQETLRNIKGKALFFIDTCHAGGVDGVSGTHRKGLTPDINGLINDLTSAENGVVVFAASTGKQSALENSAWGNGAFTLALIEALTGKSRGTVPPNRDALAAMTFIRQTGKTTIDSLDAYLAERVKQLTDGRQTPTTTKPQTVPDFPIAAVVRSVAAQADRPAPRKTSPTGLEPVTFRLTAGRSAH